MAKDFTKYSVEGIESGLGKARLVQKIVGHFAYKNQLSHDDSKGGRGKNQLIYSDNPSKKTLGMKFYLKSNTGLVNKCYEQYGTKYNLISSESFYISKDKDLIFESNLIEHLGIEKYRNLLADIAKEIL